jgi:hypothetical protein
MKGTLNRGKKEQPKKENETFQDPDSEQSSTPEISARSRESLAMLAGSKGDDDKEQQIMQLQELLADQQRELMERQEALQESQERQLSTSKAYAELSERLTNSIQLTPGPNVNKPRVPRPQDTAYKEAVKAVLAKENEEAEKEHNNEKDALKIFTNLAKALAETSKADINLPPKFYGDDDKWESWYKQWRAYLQAKGWLSTAEHEEGPGATDFNLQINDKIYNALVNLCQKGKAIAYVEQAAEFDGRGANQQLLLRYDGFSKQKLQSLKKCVENIRHISGTNITHHIDKFEKICGQMSSCGFIPDQNRLVSRFSARKNI